MTNKVRNHSRRGNGGHDDQRGVALVEFALLLSVLLLIVAGIVEVGRTFWYYDALNKATRDSARYLSTAYVSSLGVEANTATSTTKTIVVQAATKAGVPGFAAADVIVTCAPTACAAASLPGDVTLVTVAVAYATTMGSWLPFLTNGPNASYAITLAPHATMPYMR